MSNLRSLLQDAGFKLTSEEELAMQEELDNKHRGKTVLERPNKEVELKANYKDDFEPKKTQKDPTPDLVTLPKVCPEDIYETDELPSFEEGFIIHCLHTEETWYAPTELCLNANFIYREDLIIYACADGTPEDAYKFYRDITKDYMPGVITRKTCFILDNVPNETYEVYYQTNYPLIKYGQSTPNGCFVHKYPNRFHRDMAILELDDIYSNQSYKKAGKLTARKMGANEAVVISDGCWMKEVCADSFYYLDNASVIKFAEGVLPSEPEQAVLISEVRGATNALLMCVAKKKKKITYFYDNTSILNVFRNRKTEYIEEIVEYKKLLEEMDRDGYDIEFVELHPKTGEDRDVENKALMFFHNSCDRGCRDMADLFKKDYKTIATIEQKEGKSYAQVKEEYRPKGRPGQSSGKPYKPGNNYSPRKH